MSQCYAAFVNAYKLSLAHIIAKPPMLLRHSAPSINIIRKWNTVWCANI